MVEIDFVNETSLDMKEWEVQAQKLLDTGAQLLKIKEHLNLSIVFLASNQAQEMNVNFRNKTYIPDVLSFPIEMNAQEVATLKFREIGDIFICLEEAQRKTKKYDHTLKQEMSFLFVHGFLHLMGYDHENNDQEEKIMFDLQDKILQSHQIDYVIKFVLEDYGEE